MQANDADAGEGPSPHPGSNPLRTSTRFGTGVLPIITHSLMSTSPSATLTSGSGQPDSATTPSLPRSTTLQSSGADLHRPPVQPEGTEQPTPSQSMGMVSQSTGKAQGEMASQSMGSRELTMDDATIEVETPAVEQQTEGSASEQHVWGATLTRSHGPGLQAADDSMRALSSRATKKKRDTDCVVTPRTLQK